MVVIAAANLFFVGYVLFFQIPKNRRNDLAVAKLNETKWFRDLIVQPSIPFINQFYDQLHTIRGKILSDHFSIEEREEVNEFIKRELSVFRKAFIDILLRIDKKFAYQILVNLDQLIDGITDSIFDEELKLSQQAIYEKTIGSKISYSKNNLIALLYNYQRPSSPS